MDRKFRLLRADEIECRVSTIKENGLSLLLYKDARCDMSILDETVSPTCWQRDHKELKGVIYAGVGIRRADGEWIWKWDAGSESNTEKEKGEASDSFKRACVNWGIGRELYTSPFIWIKSSDCKIYKNSKDKLACDDHFNVSQIEYDNGVVSYLVIRKSNREVVFTYGIPRAEWTPRKQLISYCKENGLDIAEVAEKNDLNKESTDDNIMKVLEALKNGQ